MKPISGTAVCTTLFLVSLGTALAQQIKTDFDHQSNFSQYKTYSWQTIKTSEFSLGPDQERSRCPTGSQGLDAGRQQWRRSHRGDCDVT
jgi:hypothetical protein